MDLFRFKLLLSSVATDIVLVTALAQQLKQHLRSTLVAAQWRGDTASIVLAAVHGLLGLPGRCARSSLHSLAPPSPTSPSPSLISNLTSVDAKHNGNGNLCGCDIRSLQCTNVGKFSTNDYNYALQSLTYLSKQEGRQAVSSVLSPCWRTRYNSPKYLG